MNKITTFATAAIAALFATTSCSDTPEVPTPGEGSLLLTTGISSELTSRASISDELAAKALIWISNSDGPVRKYSGLSSVPTDGIKLLAGNYVAEAWTGDSVSASFDKKYYKAIQEFTITKGQTTDVDLKCTIANVAVAVDFAAEIDQLLTDYTVTVEHSRGSLTFVGKDTRIGFFMMPSTDTDLTWTLNGTRSNDSQFTTDGKIANAQPATLYTLRFSNSSPARSAAKATHIQCNTSATPILN